MCNGKALGLHESCITSTEQGIEHEFVLADKEKQIYRCVYCEARSNGHD